MTHLFTSIYLALFTTLLYFNVTVEQFLLHIALTCSVAIITILYMVILVAYKYEFVESEAVRQKRLIEDNFSK